MLIGTVFYFREPVSHVVVSKKDLELLLRKVPLSLQQFQHFPTNESGLSWSSLLSVVICDFVICGADMSAPREPWSLRLTILGSAVVVRVSSGGCRLLVHRQLRSGFPNLYHIWILWSRPALFRKMP